LVAILVVAPTLSGVVASSQVEEEKQQSATTTDNSDATVECASDDQQCKNPMMEDNADSENKNSNNDENDNNTKEGKREKIRMITHEELQVNVGEKDGDPIWLSVLGEVYDVTAGRDFYGPKTSYGGFSGTDCSLCFVSGVFTKEEGAKDTSEIQTNVLPGILDWRNFYAGCVSTKQHFA
jgi:predicted heme/steroid binding protein